MLKRINYTLMWGSVNKDLRLEYIYTLDIDPESKYRTIKKNTENASMFIKPSHAMSISEGFEKPRLFIPGAHITMVFDMLTKTVKATSEHLKELYPDINKPEFDINQDALNNFTINNAVSVNGYNALPGIFVTPENECKPAIRVTNAKGDFVRIPLTDAILITKHMEHFDPDTFDIQLLNIAVKDIML